MYHCDIITEIVLTFFYTDFTFLERPLSHLPCHSIFGVYYCLVALFYLTEWVEVAVVKGSLVPLLDFLSLFSGLLQFFF